MALRLFIILLLVLSLSGCTLPVPGTVSGPEETAATAPAALDTETPSLEGVTPEVPQVEDTPAPVEEIPTATFTPSPEPTHTPVVAMEQPLATATATATLALPTATQEAATPFVSAQDPETVAEAPLFRFSVQTGTPVWMPNFVRPEAACNYSGLGGQVFDRLGRPVDGLIVEVGGSLEGQAVLALTITGGGTPFGPGGYEIKLADRAVASQGEVFVELKNVNGVAQTEPIYFDTRATCEQNLVLLNFVESVTSWEVYFPVIRK